MANENIVISLHYITQSYYDYGLFKTLICMFVIVVKTLLEGSVIEW